MRHKKIKNTDWFLYNFYFILEYYFTFLKLKKQIINNKKKLFSKVDSYLDCQTTAPKFIETDKLNYSFF